MMCRSKPLLVALAAALACVLTCTPALASIDAEPVKVTGPKWGPRYDIDEVERTRLDERPSPPKPSGEIVARPDERDGEQPAAIGHVSIRRIFLVPVMSSSGEENNNKDEDTAASSSSRESSERPEMPPMMSALWPLLMSGAPQPFSPMSHRHHHDDIDEHERHQHHQHHNHAPGRPHMFGEDAASRGERENSEPARAASSPFGERGGPASDDDTMSNRPAFDPLHMILSLMSQAMQPNGPMMPPEASNRDLNKEASSPAASNDKPLELKPANITREDIVEIEGKKYVRKTVINRQVGDNIIFMTKRLIFTPLNETDSAPSTTMTPPADVSSTTTTTTSDPIESERKNPNAQSTTSTTTTSTTTTSTAAPTSTTEASTTTTQAPSSEAPSSTTSEPAVEREKIDAASEAPKEQPSSTPAVTQP